MIHLSFNYITMYSARRISHLCRRRRFSRSGDYLSTFQNPMRPMTMIPSQKATLDHFEQKALNTNTIGAGVWCSSSATTKRYLSSCSGETNNSSNNNNLEDSNNLPKGGQLEMDFFGEPVTFVGLTNKDTTSNAMAAMDGFLLAAVSKGLSCTEGGGEAGLEVRSIHSAAVSWAESLRFAAVWNQQLPVNGAENNHNKSAPMLAVVAVAPVLIQAGSAYVKHLDTLLKQTKPAAPGLPAIQMYEMAKTAAARKDDKHINPRERMHLQALDYLLQEEYPTALATYLKLLRSCPGDALALSLVVDLCQTLGDKQAALRYVRE
jgi:hypothetical protein